MESTKTTLKDRLEQTAPKWVESAEYSLTSLFKGEDVLKLMVKFAEHHTNRELLKMEPIIKGLKENIESLHPKPIKSLDGKNKMEEPAEYDKYQHGNPFAVSISWRNECEQYHQAPSYTEKEWELKLELNKAKAEIEKLKSGEALGVAIAESVVMEKQLKQANLENEKLKEVVKQMEPQNFQEIMTEIKDRLNTKQD